MPRHKTRITFYRITWEANTVVNEFGQFMSYHKRKGLNFYKNCCLKTSSRPYCVCKESNPASTKNENFEASYLY